MPETKITFGEWLPDQPGISGALQSAYNVYPQQIGYGPIPSLTDYSNSASENLTRVFSGKISSASTMFAGGATKLFKYDSTNRNLTNVSKTGGYTGGNWSFTQFGDVVLAANNSQKIQSFTLNSGTAFADVASAAPVCKYLTVVRDFVVAANISSYPNRVQWSDINDETDWTSGPTSQSDFQDIPDGGDIQGITGGEFGLVLLEKSVVRMTYIGSPLYFQFDTISREIGCYEPGSVTQYGNMTFFLSDDGFYMCDGQRVSPIGAEKVDRWFWNDLSPSYTKFSAAVDPVKKVVIWCYQNTNAGYSLLVYNWQLNRWSYGATAASYISSAATSAVTLEGLDLFSASIDALGVSLDARQWLGGRLVFAGVRDAKIVTFEGQPMSAFIETGDLSSIASIITLARPQIDNGSATVAVASREMLDDDIIYSTAVAASDENRVSLRSSGKYHRVKVVPTGNWTTMAGVDVNIVGRGRR
jgi:hypothetical protein